MWLKIRDWAGLILTCYICIRELDGHWLIALAIGMIIHCALWIFVHANFEAHRMVKEGHSMQHKY